MKEYAQIIDSVDYSFCLKNKKLSMQDLFEYLEIKGDPEASILFINRYIRINCFNSIDISEPIETFDRWANSSILSFDLCRPSERRQFINFIKEYRSFFINNHTDDYLSFLKAI